MYMYMCMHDWQTGGKKSAKQLHFPILLTENSYAKQKQPGAIEKGCSEAK